MDTEARFTEIYSTCAWGSKETVSGSSSTLVKTIDLRNCLRPFFTKYNIQSIFDCGCGDFHWFQHVSLDAITYIGADIVEQLIKENQRDYTVSTIHFQKMDILVDPPETADLWIVRDFCGLYPFESIRQLLLKFLESNSNYLAITSFSMEEPNVEGAIGILRPLDFMQAPFLFPDPVEELEDGQQWFRKKSLSIYTREQLLELPFLNATTPSTSAVDPWNTVYGTQGMRGTLLSNVPLRQQTLHVHKE